MPEQPTSEPTPVATTPAETPLTQAEEPAVAPVATPATLLRWRGDTTQYTQGVPNRDVTPDDGLTEEALQDAVDNGTHERI